MKKLFILPVLTCLSLNCGAAPDITDQNMLDAQQKLRIEMAKVNAVTTDSKEKTTAVNPALNTSKNSPLLKNPGEIQTGQKDFMDLATGKTSLRQVSKRKYDLLIFVSFSMPEEMLKEYSRQAAQYGGKLVLRGFNKSSLQKTEMKAEALNPSGVEWDIAPATFRKFKVESVPSIVLSDAITESVLENGCAKEGSYIKVDGGISIHEALTLMSLYGEPAKMTKGADLYLETENH